MTPNIYDLLIVGAGPTAVAALAGLPDGLRIAIATGAASAGRNSAVALPAKIKAVAYEAAEPAGVIDPIGFETPVQGRLFSTAAVGGLANYWGQQVVRYAQDDPWPRAIFADYAQYLECCERVERLFALIPAADAQRCAPIGGNYVAVRPRLLVSSSGDGRPSHHRAMRDVFERLTRAQQAFITNAAAVRWRVRPDYVELALDDGAVLRGRRVLMAAGAVGSLRLLMASCPQIAAVSLCDHAPTMAVTWGLMGKLKVDFGERFDHFNSLTIECRELDRVVLFASLYSMSQAPLGLSFTAVGFPPFGRGYRPPRIVDCVSPVQIWTERSVTRYQIDRGAACARVTSDCSVNSDPVRSEFLRWIRSMARVLRIMPTPAGEGFHYHDGQISHNGVEFEPVAEFLGRSFDGRVACLDGSALRKVGCRPHSLTAMAAAYQTAHQLPW